jgi:predicted Abi (CAAX) family protease
LLRLRPSIVEERILPFVFVPWIVEEQILRFIFVPSIVEERILRFVFVPSIVEEQILRFVFIPTIVEGTNTLVCLRSFDSIGTNNSFFFVPSSVH